MKALIIAAGQGKRLRPIGDTKPLVTLLGLGLIERVILTAKKSKFRMYSDVRLLLIFIGALTNQIPIMLIILAVIANFEAIRRLITFRNKLDDDVQIMNR